MAEISKRKRIWGWWFFDWASQPFHTLLVTFVFGPFFAGVAAQYYANTGLDTDTAAAQAQTVWANCLTITGLIIALGEVVDDAIIDGGQTTSITLAVVDASSDDDFDAVIHAAEALR